ncbi:MAG: hypothetical protein V3U13_05410 [Gemmatimonadota bacterium]
MRGFGAVGVIAALAGLAAPGTTLAHPPHAGASEKQATVPARTSVDSTPPEVSVYLYLGDLFEISGSDQSFLADVFLVARWYDPDLAGRSEETRTLDFEEVWHPNLLIVNQRSVSRSLPQVVRVDPSGNVQYSQRFTGRFSAFMDLKDFPLDRQEFEIWVVAARLGERRVELVPDSSVVTLANDRLSISDWTVGEPRLRRAEFRATPTAEPISGVALTIDAKRRVGYYIIQVIIPLVAIVLMAWTVFWIDSSVVPTRVGVVVTTMLTLIAYRFMLANHVPRLSYLTRLDYFMLGSTTLIILTLFAMAGTSYLKMRGRDDIVVRIDRMGRLLFPLIFGAFSLLVWLS